MRRRVILGLCLAGLPAFARADIAPDAILAQLATVKTSHAHFTETRHLAMLTAPLTLTGTLSYTAPGHVEKTTLTPKPETLVVDGDTLTLANDQATRSLSLSDVPEIGALVTAMRGALAGDAAVLAQHYTLTATGDAGHWVLLLQPREAAVQHMIQYVRLGGAGDRLTEVDTLQTDGDESDMRIVPDTP
jgi:outer membrane lipoprotein-sorting protein